jgi:EmrB/QacA subfamily drug resistance transporter
LVFIVLAMASVIVVLDTTVLSVAVPTIQRDLHTDLPSVQWVLSGYALTFASLLVVGGRLGDLFGSRRLLMLGLGLFGVGSLIAAVSQSVPQLIFGEAIVEGIGAALMTPATVSIIAVTFTARQRATAFAAWGAITGCAAALGPVVGGYLVTYQSWRWAFGLNVVVTPLSLIGTLLLVRRDSDRVRIGVDAVGAVLVATCTFALTFGLSQGPRFGFWQPLGGHPVGVVPGMLLAAVVTGVLLAVVERRKERADGDPLIAFSQFGVSRFRFGVSINFLIALGQYGVVLALPVLLQQQRHLDAFHTGVWMFPWGASIFIGAQIAVRAVHRIGPTRSIRYGSLLQLLGVALLAWVMGPHVGIVSAMGSMSIFGLGTGFMGGQLANLTLHDIDPERVGVAAGVYQTARQLASALGFAAVGAIVVALSTRWALVFGAATVGLSALLAHLMPGDPEDDEPAAPVVHEDAPVLVVEAR